MNYTEMSKLYRNKFKKYTTVQLEYALRDCHATLKLHSPDSEYSKKLWCEIDAIRDQKN